AGAEITFTVNLNGVDVTATQP
ncbi:MAG: hypothetical protein RLZZ557_353, partial [Bacteroidota bacterium]